jgi:hypothetical protein
MGSSQSALLPLKTRMEPEGSPNSMEPPKQIANETAEQKFYRKVSFFVQSISPDDNSE